MNTQSAVRETTALAASVLHGLQRACSRRAPHPWEREALAHLADATSIAAGIIAAHLQPVAGSNDTATLAWRQWCTRRDRLRDLAGELRS